jgi:excisionase family DNA binding protein
VQTHSDELLTVTEVAALGSFSEEHVRRLIRAGVLHAYQHGRRWRIPRSSWRAYLAANTAAPTTGDQ